MPERDAYIGFPKGLLCDRPVRFQVLANEAGWFVLQKSRGVPGQVHPWYKNKADVTSSIRSQIVAGKGELKRLGIGELFYICGPEPESSGPMLFAKNKASADFLSNAFGSNLFRFTFWLIARSKTSESRLQCDLPLLGHLSEPRALVSHRQGKKATTHFHRLRCGSDFSLWEAKTYLPRYHQIRLHAHEVGLSIVGESLYGTENLEPMLNQQWKGSSPSSFKGLALLLRSLDFGRVCKGFTAKTSKIPEAFSAFLKKSGLNQA